MKTKLLLIALVAALAIPMQGQNFRHTDNVVNSQKAQYTASREVIPDGMAMVTLAVGDVWGDGTGYQMLLDADANTYGDIIPTSGPLALYYSVDASVYAEFEYKIPENADGSLYTENFLFEETVSILIPAGTYDWVITNPEYAYAMWIASDYGQIPGRYDDFVFEAGKQYIFTPYMTDYGYDGVALEIVDGEVGPVVYDETCAAPNGQYIIIDKEKALVTITNNEPGATVHYVVTLDGVVIEEGDFTGDTWEYIADGPGTWQVSCVASLPGKNDSNPGGVFFPIAPGQQPVAVDEMMAGKSISNVRYFNAAGQEMQEANGLTIVVTTYTDGTTNAAKVVK